MDYGVYVYDIWHTWHKGLLSASSISLIIGQGRQIAMANTEHNEKGCLLDRGFAACFGSRFVLTRYIVFALVHRDDEKRSPEAAM